jgi:hypothetical protein
VAVKVSKLRSRYANETAKNAYVSALYGAELSSYLAWWRWWRARRRRVRVWKSGK